LLKNGEKLNFKHQHEKYTFTPTNWAWHSIAKHIVNLNHKALHIITLLAFVATFFANCGEEYEANIFENGKLKVVIEGQLIDSAGVSYVRVTQAAGITDSVEYFPIDNAEVSITDRRGHRYNMINTQNGYYRNYDLIGNVDQTYLLHVKIGNEVYYSHAKMPPPVLLDSISMNYNKTFNFRDTIGYYITLHSSLNDDTVQYYRIRLKVRGKEVDAPSNMMLYEDAHQLNKYSMQLPFSFAENDTVSITIYSLTSTAYEYYSSLQKLYNKQYSNIQPPSINPTSNIVGDALGIFQTSAISTYSIVIDARPMIYLHAKK